MAIAQPILGPAAWHGKDPARSTDWIRHIEQPSEATHRGR